jgi:hypothetical protein
VIITVADATLILPEREPVPVFVWTRNVNDPFPVPLTWEKAVIQGMSLATVHAQPAPAVTVTVPPSA